MKRLLTLTGATLVAAMWLAMILTAGQAAPAPGMLAPVRELPARSVLSAGPSSALSTRQRSGLSPARIDYQRQIRPILTERCLECHSQDKRKGGLSLATYPDALEGGRSGAVIRPGRGARSLLIHRVSGVTEPQMPKDEDPLSAQEIALLRRWIDQGARETPMSPPAPPPWEAPLALTRPVVPAIVWADWTAPLDRLVSAYLAAHKVPEPEAVSDAVFARRVYLDVWGLLPAPEELQAFVEDRRPRKREALVARLLADDQKYADNWISFWNDLLRNEDGVTYFSETAGRKSITDWLLPALTSNLPYDRFVSKLLNPAAPDDPDGFLVGVNWRGETSAAVTPWMQASQNTAQLFLGINLKCNSCHDSFVSRWKLKDAYALAAFFSPEPKLQLFRCDVARDQYAEPGFLYPAMNRIPSSSSLSDRRAAAAAIFTDPRMGRLPRTLVNRVWQRLFGRGLVPNPDEMDSRPWSPDVLDWVASDFVANRYDIKRLIGSVLNSRAYQMPSVARNSEPPARGYVFAGPEVRRLTAEQFADAVGSITGEWNVYPGRPAAAAAPAAGRGAAGRPTVSMPATAGMYGREWRIASSNLTRALGRPIRDQVNSLRPTQSSTLQALELVNGEIFTRWLSRGARRMLGALPPEPLSLYNRTVAGRASAASSFEVDITNASRLWLVVQEGGSNIPEVIKPVWAQAEFVGPAGVTPLASVTPMDGSGLRTGSGPIAVTGAPAATAATAVTGGTAGSGSAAGGIRVKNPSVVVYDVAGKGFTRFRGIIGLENPQSEIGSTLNPQIRFFVFNAEPNVERLVPPAPGPPLPAPSPVTDAGQAIDRVFWHALGRPPSAAERGVAEDALRDPSRGSRPSPQGLADLLWAVTMKPEFQLIY